MNTLFTVDHCFDWSLTVYYPIMNKTVYHGYITCFPRIRQAMWNPTLTWPKTESTMGPRSDRSGSPCSSGCPPSSCIVSSSSSSSSSSASSSSSSLSSSLCLWTGNTWFSLLSRGVMKASMAAVPSDARLLCLWTFLLMAAWTYERERERVAERGRQKARERARKREGEREREREGSLVKVLREKCVCLLQTGVLSILTMV